MWNNGELTLPEGSMRARISLCGFQQCFCHRILLSSGKWQRICTNVPGKQYHKSGGLIRECGWLRVLEAKSAWWRAQQTFTLRALKAKLFHAFPQRLGTASHPNSLLAHGFITPDPSAWISPFSEPLSESPWCQPFHCFLSSKPGFFYYTLQNSPSLCLLMKGSTVSAGSLFLTPKFVIASIETELTKWKHYGYSLLIKIEINQLMDGLI